MTFAKALARIEELLHGIDRVADGTNEGYAEYRFIRQDLFKLLEDYAESIVQLGKVTSTLRHMAYYTEEFGDACEAYDKLMKGEE